MGGLKDSQKYEDKWTDRQMNLQTDGQNDEQTERLTDWQMVDVSYSVEEI